MVKGEETNEENWIFKQKPEKIREIKHKKMKIIRKTEIN